MFSHATRKHKRVRGARLTSVKGRKGWYIAWYEPRADIRVAPYKADPQHGLRLADTPRGVMVAADPPREHALTRYIGRGDLIILVGSVRVGTVAQFNKAIHAYAGEHIGLRVNRGGKEGCVRRVKKAGVNRDEAEGAFAKWLAQRKRADDGLPEIAERADLTFAQLVEETVAWANTAQSGYSPGWARAVGFTLRLIAQHYGPYLLKEITPAMLGKWADERAGDVTPATLGNNIKALRAAFRLAVARQYVETDPSAGLKIAAPRAARPKYLKPDQIALLLKCARQADAERLCASTGAVKVKERAARKWYNADGTFDAARIRFLLLSGLRRSQLTSLTWSQYDRERGSIVLESRPDHTEKSKRVNVVPLPREARAIIDAQPAGAPYIFPNLHGERDTYIGFRIIRIAALVQQRGGWHFHLHLLRHTALTMLLKHTHDPAAVQRFAGHADMKTTLRYAWVLDDQLKIMTDDFNPMNTEYVQEKNHE